MDFCILKVNGQDLSKSTHEEAVEAFRNAKEPIVVEVLRRVSKNSNNKTMKSRSPASVSVATQTDDFIENNAYYGIYRSPTPPPALMALHGHGLYQPSSRQPVAFSPNAEMGLTDLEMANGVEFFDDYDERAYEMEYEEVVLHRSSSEEKIGLTLCYGSVDEEETDIYISEIEPYSIAAQDGRIREGDQILQINGVDVHSRDEAIQLFSQNRSDITLVLARPQLQFDDGFMDDRNVLDDLHSDLLERHHHNAMEFTSALLGQGLPHDHNDEEGGTTDTATTENSQKHEKDSGVGRTDESCRNDESSEQEILENEYSPKTSLKFHSRKLGNGDLQYSNDSFTSNETHDDFRANEIPEEECAKFRQVLQNRCDKTSLEAQGPKGSQSSLERELALLNHEMEEIQLECQQIVQMHMKQQEKIQSQANVLQNAEVMRSPRLVPRMGTRLEYLKHNQNHDNQSSSEQIWVRHDSVSSQENKNTKRNVDKLALDDKDNSSSAYNTGESCRSTPLTLELMKEEGHKSSMLFLAHDTSALDSDTEKMTQTAVRPNSSAQSHSDSIISTVNANQNDIENSNAQQSEVSSMKDSESMTDLYAKYSDIMYTNPANLEHTIAIQQKLFQQKLGQSPSKSSSKSASSQSLSHQEKIQNENNTKLSQNGNLSPGVQTAGQSDSQMEWVVKRRADGSRYVTRRPVRAKILKDRAKKITEERCGMTTDDEAMSELKVGRYWNREERKRHIERVKDHKRRKEFMLKARMETLKEQENEGKKEINIVELSHRKMMRHKNKKVLDDFTTVQEMMVHGNKMPELNKAHNPLLSVTTV